MFDEDPTIPANPDFKNLRFWVKADSSKIHTIMALRAADEAMGQTKRNLKEMKGIVDALWENGNGTLYGVPTSLVGIVSIALTRVGRLSALPPSEKPPVIL